MPDLNRRRLLDQIFESCSTWKLPNYERSHVSRSLGSAPVSMSSRDASVLTNPLIRRHAVQVPDHHPVWANGMGVKSFWVHKSGTLPRPDSFSLSRLDPRPVTTSYSFHCEPNSLGPSTSSDLLRSAQEISLSSSLPSPLPKPKPSLVLYNASSYSSALVLDSTISLLFLIIPPFNHSSSSCIPFPSYLVPPPCSPLVPPPPPEMIQSVSSSLFIPNSQFNFSSHPLSFSDSPDPVEPDLLAIIPLSPLNSNYFDLWQISQDLLNLIVQSLEFSAILKLSDLMSVDSAKQKVALTAAETHRKRNRESRSKLEMELRRLGLDCPPPTSRFWNRSAHSI
ncbi:unnamed protein product [Linum trigynum]|uniref:Uncharacterized protein n=1 Tax=Linum trigynum TaxID=586398 RepID=A0AAV2DY66_9ROSI